MPAPGFQIRTHALAYLGLAALFLLSVTYFARVAFDRIDFVRHASEYVRPPFYLGDANWGAVGLQPEAEAASARNVPSGRNPVLLPLPEPSLETLLTEIVALPLTGCPLASMTVPVMTASSASAMVISMPETV
jgi:hypothetical protein